MTLTKTLILSSLSNFFIFQWEDASEHSTPENSHGEVGCHEFFERLERSSGFPDQCWVQCVLPTTCHCWLVRCGIGTQGASCWRIAPRGSSSPGGRWSSVCIHVHRLLVFEMTGWWEMRTPIIMVLAPDRVLVFVGLSVRSSWDDLLSGSRNPDHDQIFLCLCQWRWCLTGLLVSGTALCNEESDCKLLLLRTSPCLAGQASKIVSSRRSLYDDNSVKGTIPLYAFQRKPILGANRIGLLVRFNVWLKIVQKADQGRRSSKKKKKKEISCLLKL